MIVEGVERGGGLAILWMSDANVEVWPFSKNHIDAVIGEAKKERRQRFTGFYGDPDTNRCQSSWDLL